MNADRTPPPPGLLYRVSHILMWPLLMPLRLTCRHFAELCSARLDRPLTDREKLLFKVHAVICSFCRPMPDEFEKLRHLIRCCESHAEPATDAKPLSKEAEARIREALARE